MQISISFVSFVSFVTYYLAMLGTISQTVTFWRCHWFVVVVRVELATTYAGSRSHGSSCVVRGHVTHPTVFITCVRMFLPRIVINIHTVLKHYSVTMVTRLFLMAIVTFVSP